MRIGFVLLIRGQTSIDLHSSPNFVSCLFSTVAGFSFFSVLGVDSADARIG